MFRKGIQVVCLRWYVVLRGQGPNTKNGRYWAVVEGFFFFFSEQWWCYIDHVPTLSFTFICPLVFFSLTNAWLNIVWWVKSKTFFYLAICYYCSSDDWLLKDTHWLFLLTKALLRWLAWVSAHSWCSSVLWKCSTSNRILILRILLHILLQGSKI